MKRMHVHIGVSNLDRSIAFYEALFGSPPTVQKPGYAKWRIDDPAINLAISQNGGEGVDHLGVDVEDAAELAELSARLTRANETVIPEDGAQCCYAQSDKAWARDPSGVVWEAFHTFGEAEIYGEDETRARLEALDGRSAPCCS